MQLEIAVLSERGGRAENQDACGYWSGADASYFVLCDGAGGHLGDSRLYCFRAGGIVAQTRDHSVVQSLVDAGYLAPQQLRTSPDRSKLLSALGDAERFDPAVEHTPFAIAPGDRFLLCTDGLWEYVQEAEMQQALQECGAADDWLRALERLVLERGTRKHDNYSAVAIWCAE